MSISFRIPTILRTYTGGESIVEVSTTGDTLSHAIQALESIAPGISSRLLDDSGNLRRFVNVYVDEDDVRFLDGLNSVITEGQQISIVPAVAGG